MDHFLKKFTVIDFLGIFVPGAAVVLAWNYYLGGVIEPFSAFFGTQPAILVFYFAFCGYFVGMLLQEASKPLDCLLEKWKKVNDTHQEKQQEPKIKQHYESCFGKALADVDVQEAWRNIYLYVQPQASESKVPLFRAFSAMGRTCAAASAAVFLLYLYALWAGLANCSPFPPAACGVVLWAMLRRYKRFHIIAVEYIYAIFIKSGNEQKPCAPAAASAGQGA